MITEAPQNINKKLRKLNRKLNKKQEDLERFGSAPFVGFIISEKIKELKKEIAWLYLECGEFEKGLAIYQSMSWKTQGEEKYVGMVRAHTEMGYVAEAERLLKKGLKRFPESYSLWVAMGNLYHRSGNFLRSLKCFEQALVFNPDNFLILYNKANALHGLRLYEDAFSIYSNLLTMFPYNMDLLVQMGHCSLNTGYPEDAAEYFKSCLDNDHIVADIYTGLFCAYDDMGLANEATKTAEEGLKRFPDEDSALYINAGIAYYEQGWMEEAMEIFHEGLKKFPEDEDLKEVLKAIEDETDDPDKGNKPPLIFAVIIRKIRKYKPMNKRV